MKLMVQVRQVLRYHLYAYRTEQTYCDWIVRFIKFHGSQTHPAQMGKEQIDAFLKGQGSASTQRQVNAIIFLYRHVLDQPIEDRLEPVKAKRHARPPTVMTQSEVQRVMEQMVGTHLLMAKMLYGCGLRLMKCVCLRVQDLVYGSQYSLCARREGGQRPHDYFSPIDSNGTADSFGKS